MAVSTIPRYKQTWAWERLRWSWVGDFVRGFRGCKREFWAWLQCPRVVLPEVEQLAASLKIFQPQITAAAAAEQETEAPIFLLSTGLRAGSTLLQRILLTDPRLLLWGEPLGEMTIVSRLAEMIGHSISSRNLQQWRDQPDPASPELTTAWVANLYPPASDFRQALRSLFDRWLCEPARQRGFARWGFKEVRLGATEASLLHWLYPKSKFLIITRHPYDSFRSLADANWDQVYYTYPTVPLDSAASFARHWNRLAVSWSRLPAGFPCVHIKYEDLIAGKVDFRKIESWLGIEIRENVALKVSVGGTAKRAQLSWYERWIIAREAAEGMRALGYPK
jgi:sulfotransferase family protein